VLFFGWLINRWGNRSLEKAADKALLTSEYLMGFHERNKDQMLASYNKIRQKFGPDYAKRLPGGSVLETMM
jgi:hypothetical protein